MSTPTDSPRDELRTLRERAYGPDADIHEDPIALARLHELQAADQAARIAAQAVAPVAGGGDAAPGIPLTEEATDAAEERRPWDEPAADPPAAPEDGSDAAPDDEGETGAAPARPWWRRRIPVLWAGSVVAALLLGVGLTLGVQAVDAGRIAVLQEDEDAEWPEAWFGSRPADGRVFEDFHGLTVLVFPQSMGSDGSQSCLYVVTPPDASGFGAGSCGAGSFPATASMEISRLSPSALRDAFADGTALQFVHEGSVVNVYAKTPGVIEPTPGR